MADRNPRWAVGLTISALGTCVLLWNRDTHFAWEQWFSTFPMLRLFKIQFLLLWLLPTKKIISLLLRNCKFATIMNYNVNISISSWSFGVTTYGSRPAALDCAKDRCMRRFNCFYLCFCRWLVGNLLAHAPFHKTQTITFHTNYSFLCSCNGRAETLKLFNHINRLGSCL